MSSFLFIILGIVVGIITLLLSEVLSMWIIAFLTTQDNQLEGNITMDDSEIYIIKL